MKSFFISLVIAGSAQAHTFLDCRSARGSMVVKRMPYFGHEIEYSVKYGDFLERGIIDRRNDELGRPVNSFHRGNSAIFKFYGYYIFIRDGEFLADFFADECQVNFEENL